MKLPSTKGIIAVYGDQDLAPIAKKLLHQGRKMFTASTNKNQKQNNPHKMSKNSNPDQS
jgi:hypothetical protein